MQKHSMDTRNIYLDEMEQDKRFELIKSIKNRGVRYFAIALECLRRLINMVFGNKNNE